MMEIYGERYKIVKLPYGRTVIKIITFEDVNKNRFDRYYIDGIQLPEQFMKSIKNKGIDIDPCPHYYLDGRQARDRKRFKVLRR